VSESSYYHFSKFKGRVRPHDESMIISVKKRDELIEYCEPFVRYKDDAYFDGLNIRLLTNIEHVHNFWSENWWPCIPSIVPHGVIYTIDDGGKLRPEEVYEREFENPSANTIAVWNPETKTAFILNTDYYGQTKPVALGMSADILEEQGILSVHGASGAVDGRGYILIAPTNTGKTTHSYGPVIHHPRGEFHQDDWIYVHFVGDKTVGYASERRFYMRTNSIANFPWLEPIFRKSKLENVAPEDPIDKFLLSYPRVMIDPSFIVNPNKVVLNVRIHKTFLLKRDKKDKTVARSLDPEEAVEILKNAPEKWYNNYLISFGERKDKIRERLFKKLFERAEPYLINIIADVEKVRNIIIKIVKSEG